MWRVKNLIRKNALRIDTRSVVVQRLKRVHSIFHKLLREENMNLSRMEDIGGCRAVVDNIKNVNNLYKKLYKSRTKHTLYRIRDYISNPKESGYRGIHMIYKYNGSKEKYHGIPIEIQLRSKIQHSWATAVEVIGTFTKQSLKASSGEKIWLDFFRYASAEFGKLEKCSIDKRYEGINTFEKLDECIKRLDLRSRLKGFNTAVVELTKKTVKDAKYYVLLLDLEKNIIRIARFKFNQLNEATELYDSEEEKYKDDATKDLVMVSANSLNDLKMHTLIIFLILMNLANT